MNPPKRTAGQPKKEDAKVPFSTRLHPDVVDIIKKQPNKAEFIEKAVLKYIQYPNP